MFDGIKQEADFTIDVNSKSVQEIAKQISYTADFTKLGYSFSDSQELAKLTNIYSLLVKRLIT